MAVSGMQQMVDSNGRSTDPLGIPQFNCCRREMASLILIETVLSDKYDVTHASADSQMPIDLICWNRIAWSTVSKAAVRSMRTSITPFLRSSACMMSS